MDKRRIELAQNGLQCIKKELSQQYPYMRPAIYYLTPVSDEKEKRISTDGKYLFYHPEYVLSCFASEKAYSGLAYQFLHILLHCLLGHVCRKNDENEFLYDECADYLVDRVLERMTGKVRKRPERFEAWEEHCDFKRKTRERSLSGFRNYCKSKKEAQEYLQKIGKYVYSDNHQYWTKKNPAAPSEEKERGIAGEDWWYLRSQVMGMASIMGKGGLGGLRAVCEAGERWEERAASAENSSNYKSLLQRMCSVREVVQTTDVEFDYIWYEIGIELYGNIPLIEPAECTEELVADDIIIAIDTSGSCSGEVASRFLRETCNLLRDMHIRDQCRIRILQCDVQIQKEILIQSEEEIPDFQNQVVYGYGGTDFRPVFTYIEECREKGEIQKISGLIYLTDAEGVFPDQCVDYETVFVVWSMYDDVFRGIPDWITKVKLTEQDMEELSV